MKTRNCVTGAIMTSLMVLAGCSTQRPEVIPPEPIVVTKTVYRTPPDNLVRICTVGEFRGTSNGDMLDWTLATIAILRDCNQADNDAYRKWLERNQ